jgi:hypothetical protein
MTPLSAQSVDSFPRLYETPVSRFVEFFQLKNKMLGGLATPVSVVAPMRELVATRNDELHVCLAYLCRPTPNDFLKVSREHC